MGDAIDGLPLGAVLQIDDLGIVAPHEHTLVLDNVALGSKRDDVGDASRLPDWMAMSAMAGLPMMVRMPAAAASAAAIEHI